MSDSIKYDVNIDLANKAKKDMKASMASANPRILHRDGAFSALYDIQFPEYKEPVLVLKTEEPGSKQLLAFRHDKVESVCHDMINHLINDCVVMGARPLTVQDAIICGKIDGAIVTRIVKAVSQACRDQGCELTGGETSEQPGVIPEGTYILSSSIVGIVEKSRIIDGSAIRSGDLVLCLESSGIHTNGYTLVRRLMEKRPEILAEKVAGVSFIDAVLEPHRCYYSAIRELFEKDAFTGLAHITGGGIRENLDRVLPADKDAVIDAAKYDVLPIFKLIRKHGNVDPSEMLRTFNLGVGIAAVVRPENAELVIDHVAKFGIRAYEIGAIVEGSRQVRVEGEFKW